MAKRTIAYPEAIEIVKEEISFFQGFTAEMQRQLGIKKSIRMVAQSLHRLVEGMLRIWAETRISEDGTLPIPRLREFKTLKKGSRYKGLMPALVIVILNGLSGLEKAWDSNTEEKDLDLMGAMELMAYFIRWFTREMKDSMEPYPMNDFDYDRRKELRDMIRELDELAGVFKRQTEAAKWYYRNMEEDLQFEHRAMRSPDYIPDRTVKFNTLEQMLVVPKETLETMSEEELDKLYKRHRMNSRKSLAPVFILEILRMHADHGCTKFTQEQIRRELEGRYEITLEHKAMSRIMGQLVDSELGVLREAGKNGKYWYDLEEEQNMMADLYGYY